MRSFTSLALLSLGLSLTVNAHGFPSSLVVDGTTYAGANGASASSDSPWQNVASGDPVKDETSDAIICGTSAKTATGTAKVNPGDSLQIYWSNEGGGNWIHNVGPIMSYMAQCDGDCSSYTPSTSTKWFKIDQVGLISGTTTWAQASLTTGAPANVTIPTNLASGQYLLRHEIIALQGAQSLGGAEFYPACAQLTVGGSGTGTPDTTVSFPGAYSASDPGIEVDVYTALGNYVFPGGAVATISGSGGSGSGNSGSGSSSAASSGSGVTSSVVGTATGTNAGAVPTSTSTSTNSGSGSDSGSTGTGKCSSKKFKLKRRDNSTSSSKAKKRHARKMQKRVISRVFGMASD